MADEFLDIVSENDEVIGQALRSEVHEKGLWHREVGVFFITPAGEVIFQIRGSNVDTNPDTASVTAGGHVKAGLTHLEGVIEETLEETGWRITADQLHLIKETTSDKKTPGRHNRAVRKYYGYIFHGKPEDLKIEEEGMGGGFYACPLEKIFNPDDETRQKLGDYLDPEKQEFFLELQRLVA